MFVHRGLYTERLMRLLVLFLLAGAAVAQAPFYKPFAILPDLTAGILLAHSDAIFNVPQHAPKNDEEWTLPHLREH
jgi:hypothetical protein